MIGVLNVRPFPVVAVGGGRLDEEQGPLSLAVGIAVAALVSACRVLPHRPAAGGSSGTKESPAPAPAAPYAPRGPASVAIVQDLVAEHHPQDVRTQDSNIRQEQPFTLELGDG